MKPSVAISIGIVLDGATAISGQPMFQLPSSLGSDVAKLDSAPVSFGFPFATLPGYFPGIDLTLKCLDTFKASTGVWPAIRIGGTSEDYAFFDPDLDVPNVVTGTAPTGQSATIFGPELMRLVQRYEGTIVWGVNRGANNITNAIEASTAAIKNIPNLYALELGNEPDIFGELKQPVASTAPEWNPKTEAESESEWQTAIGNALGKDRLFQAASYYQPPNLGWGAQSYFQYANDSADHYIKVFSHHNYPQSAIAMGEEPPNVKNLMSHINVTANIGLYKDDVKAANARGFDYVFGETNSVSGNGQPGQGASFGTALWVLDYMLQAASRNIKRAYFHQGTPGKSYYVWFNETGVRSPLYGGYVAAEAMAQGTSIVPLDDGSTNYAGYSIHSENGKAEKVVLINTDFFDGTGPRPTQLFTLKGLQGAQVQARRLTAKSTLSQQDLGEFPSYAGRTIDDQTCKPTGKEAVESVSIEDGSAVFNLAASEALVITL